MKDRLSPEEAHAVNRLMDPSPKYEPLRRYIAVYRYGNGEVHLSHIAFTNQIAAWTTPRGPNIPEGLQVIDVIDIQHQMKG